MAWCEKNAVFYLIGLAKNDRLRAKIRRKMDFAHIRYLQTAVATRRFASFYYRTQKSWTRARRVVGKAIKISYCPCQMTHACQLLNAGSRTTQMS